MNMTDCALWVETTTGRRMLVASTSCRLYATLLGEALWTHCLQLRTIALPLRLLEIWESAPRGDATTHRLLARWSASGREHLPKIAPSEARRTEETPMQHVKELFSSEAERRSDERAGLSAFFPTEEEWMAWKRWKEERDV
jgi:hypothetical protein